MAVVTPEPRTRWSAEAIEEVVLDLLGNLLGEDSNNLRRRLLEKGMMMPVDSLDLFDVLVEFRQVTGLKVPIRKLRRQTMRSIKSFADFVAKEGQA